MQRGSYSGPNSIDYLGRIQITFKTIQTPATKTRITVESKKIHPPTSQQVELNTGMTIAEAVTREMAKAHVHYQAILNERGATTLQTSLKGSSGANGFKAMDPFDWTKNKSIYQRW